MSEKNINGDFMLITLIRTALLYFLVVACIRLMGKRQLGELQPTELVITFLFSEIAAIPLQDNGVPFINSVVCIVLLAALEIINSAICLKSAKARSIIEGNSVIVIRNGVVDQAQLKKLRYSVEDLIAQLRQKDIFDINDVRYAIVETNGQLSVMLKPEKETVTAEMIDIKNDTKALLCMVINDGQILKKAFNDCNMTDSRLKSILNKNKVNVNEILFMLADCDGNYTIVRKEKFK